MVEDQHAIQWDGAIRAPPTGGTTASQSCYCTDDPHSGNPFGGSWNWANDNGRLGRQTPVEQTSAVRKPDIRSVESKRQKTVRNGSVSKVDVS